MVVVFLRLALNQIGKCNSSIGGAWLCFGFGCWIHVGNVLAVLICPARTLPNFGTVLVMLQRYEFVLQDNLVLVPHLLW